MANPTTNFGWVMPTSTSLVTNLPADFNTFGQGVDTTMAQLKGGTTGQILSKTSSTDMAFTWITNDVGDITAVTAGTGISGGGTSGAVTITNSMATEITAAGDIIVGTGSGTFDNLPIGTTGQILTADTTVSPYKVKWATAASGSALTLVQRTSFSSVASQTFDNVFTTTYENYIVYFNMMTASTNADDPLVYLRYGSPAGDLTSTCYYNRIKMTTAGSTVTGSAYTNGNFVQLADNTGASADRGAGWMNFMDVGNTANKGNFTAQYTDTNSGESAWLSGAFSSGSGNNKIVTGFRVQSSSSTITGTVSIYGLAKS